MGAQCCQAEPSGVQSLIVEQKASPATYYESEFPKDDQYLSKELKSLEQAPQTAAIFKHPTLKHKYLEKYYKGNWQNAKMSGLGLLYIPDVVLYVGEFHGNPDGKGKAELIKEGIIYEGMLKDGKAEGPGIAYSIDKKYYFDGDWKNSTIENGTLTITNGGHPSSSNSHFSAVSNSNPNEHEHKNEHTENQTKTILTFHNHPLQSTTIHYPDGRVYVGAVDRRTFVPAGMGEVKFADDSKYSGSWEQGEMHGKGIFTWPDGTYYEGEYQNGKKHGNGKFRFASMNVYEGDWANGKMEGKGVIVDNSGTVIRKGIWKEGVYLKEQEK